MYNLFFSFEEGFLYRWSIDLVREFIVTSIISASFQLYLKDFFKVLFGAMRETLKLFLEKPKI